MKRDVNQLKTGFFSAISSVVILHMLHSQNNGKFHFEETFLPFIIMIIKNDNNNNSNNNNKNNNDNKYILLIVVNEIGPRLQRKNTI